MQTSLAWHARWIATTSCLSSRPHPRSASAWLLCRQAWGLQQTLLQMPKASPVCNAADAGASITVASTTSACHGMQPILMYKSLQSLGFDQSASHLPTDCSKTHLCITSVPHGINVHTASVLTSARMLVPECGTIQKTCLLQQPLHALCAKPCSCVACLPHFPNKLRVNPSILTCNDRLRPLSWGLQRQLRAQRTMQPP